ncbi:M48 family metallopeptidase [Parvularcula sp. IMCC14364]|uniref:M48 family metallopeptidase n=1 Tax=Parvularcula sp. IMCC14364 TaxID=3067902 RepID=UPI00274299AF|nr:M48 family metallopeptidase [Parvularcula sp. IMCC14364]
MGAYGLQSHIWNNNLKSILLMAGFPFLLCVLLYGFILMTAGVSGRFVNLPEAMLASWGMFLQNWPLALIGAAVWFLIAWMFHQKMINAATGAKPVSRKEAPDLYNMLENLCIERGMTMPRLCIINSAALNAYASGIDDSNYTVTLTSGLIKTLDQAELRAVIAHELTHIRNRDVRLLIISVIFVGIFSFIGELIFRGFFRVGRHAGGYSRGRNGDSRGGGAVILIAIAIIAVSYLLALVIRFAISRRREYLADAGAVDLTRDPDAMISALKKISGRSALEVPNDVQQMCIDNDQPFAGVFLTHPKIEKRIAALVAYAGGQN